MRVSEQPGTGVRHSAGSAAADTASRIGGRPTEAVHTERASGSGRFSFRVVGMPMLLLVVVAALWQYLPGLLGLKAFVLPPSPTSWPSSVPRPSPTSCGPTAW